MPLSLIVGPPNSGRAGEIRRALSATLPAEPVLVVPTGDDVARFERELSDGAHSSAVIGASVRTFERLFEDVADAVGADSPPLLSGAQRRRAIALGAARCDDARMRALSRRPAFVSALVRAIDDLQAGRADPATMESAAAGIEDGRGMLSLAAAYRGYLELRDGLGRGDPHLLAERAIAGLRAAPDAWGARPVFLYGFDDLSEEQLGMVAALAGATRVVAAVTYEDGRAPLAARATLLGRLSEIADGPAREMAPNEAHTASRTLYAIERGFGEDDPSPVAPDGGLALIESVGERAEAETIAAEVARLIAEGTPSHEIAVALRSVDRAGPLYASVLDRLGVPAAVHAKLPLASTGTGAGLLALLRAASGGGPADLIAYLRAPGRAHPDQVDWLERAVRRRRLRTVDEALEQWNGRDLDELAELRGEGAAVPQGERARGARSPGVGLCLALADVARRMTGARRPRTAPLLDGVEALEARAAQLVARTAEELAELDELAPELPGLAAEIEALEVPLSHGPAEGRVQVSSPYRLRAGRFAHVFVASLQEGEFPGAAPRPGLIADEERAAIGLPERADPEAEERYLFYVCISRPTERLHLSWRIADDDGSAEASSPFVEEVRELLAPSPPLTPGDPDELLARLTRARGPGSVVLDPELAPSADELGRAVAALGHEADHRAALAALGLDHESAEALAVRLERARERRRPLPNDLHHPLVHEALADRPPFGASTLETYSVCSYRWFVDHELRPQPLDPRPEPLEQGSVVHATLERLYAEPPAEGPLPTPATLGAWLARARELLAEIAEQSGLGPHDAARRAGLERMETLLGAFLARESRRDWELAPEPELLEAAFGTDTEVGPLDLGDFRMRGSIDRVDVGVRSDGTRVGVVRDYKLSTGVTAAAKLEDERKLQLQLYMLALRRLWGIEPIGGLYEPLGAAADAKPRGMLLATERGALLPDRNLTATDFREPEEFREALERARELAATAVEGMRAGRVDRNPLGGACPRYCSFQPICRRERATLESLEEERPRGGEENGVEVAE
jgi:hypothetical protein